MWMWVWLGVRREGCVWGSGWCAGAGVVGERLRAYGSQMGLKSYVFAGGKKFEWKRMTGQRIFVAMLDAFGVTPV